MRQVTSCISPPRPSMRTSFSEDDDNCSQAPSFVRGSGSGSSPRHRKTNSSSSARGIVRPGAVTPTELAASKKTPEPPKTTHIRVLARIRPVEIHVERQGFFDSNKSSSNQGGGGSRRSRLPSPKSLSSSIPRKPNIPSRSMATASKASSLDSNISEITSVVAWDVSEDGDTAMQSESNTTLIQGRTHSYTLDKIYGCSSNTQELYEESISPLVRDALDGYHSSILAYGQTSTGKTFTMTGTPDSPGLIPLCMHECFRQLKQSSNNANRDYLFRLSYLEVYKEHIRDLLATSPQPIRLFENAKTGLVIKGLNEVIVTSPEQIFQLLREGEGRRQVGATHMNQHSSRSHVIVRLWIESSVATSSRKGNIPTTISSLSLVDLAGSESVRLNGGERRQEGQYINKSLMTLGQVVLQLSEQSNGNGRYKQHIPYRDSKLTRLLQPSLSGNARMVLLCCISPMSTHLEESHNTFKFATRAKRIKQKAVVNTTSGSDGDAETLLQTYRDEIDDLKRQLKEARQEQQNATAPGVESAPAAPVDEEEVHELVEAIQTMERLILKSRPLMNSSSSASLASGDVSQSRSSLDLDLLLEDDKDTAATETATYVKNGGLTIETNGSGDGVNAGSTLSESSPLSFPTTPVTNHASEDEQLHSELNRIQGLLGSVLKKRGVPNSSRRGGNIVAERRKQFDFASPVRDNGDKKEHEVMSLRKQLKDQEVASNLRKADSSFLQSQLAEKDQLLEEIAKVLEAVETRQAFLERENAALRNELTAIKARFAIF